MLAAKSSSLLPFLPSSIGGKSTQPGNSGDETWSQRDPVFAQRLGDGANYLTDGAG